MMQFWADYLDRLGCGAEVTVHPIGVERYFGSAPAEQTASYA
jgi:hypothetical protein